MRRRLLRLAYPALFRLRAICWRVLRPRTFGVRVVIRNPQTGAILLVRHRYGRRHLWFPPGGGYRPSRETAEDAGRREVREEVGIVLDELVALGVYRTSAGGNHDTVTLFLAEAQAIAAPDCAEIAEHRWVTRQDLDAGLPLARVTRDALRREMTGKPPS